MPTVTLSGAQVTYDRLRQSQPDTVQGSPTVYVSSEFNVNRSAILFDTSSITGPVTVSAATFAMTGNGGNADAVNDIDFLKLLTAPVIGQATWNSYSTGNSWLTGGAFNSTDAVLTPAFTLSNYLIAGSNTDTSAGLIALVQDWINTPANNKGLLAKIVSDLVADGAYVTGLSPTLEIVYTAGGGSPTSYYLSDTVEM